MPLFCTNRDVVLASLERFDSDQRCYILALRSTEHPLMQQSRNSSKIVRYITQVINFKVVHASSTFFPSRIWQTKIVEWSVTRYKILVVSTTKKGYFMQHNMNGFLTITIAFGGPCNVHLKVFFYLVDS